MLLADLALRELYHPLVLFGFAAQAMFMLRFVVQWLASERRRQSYVPIAFWYLSCLGGVMLFVYALLREDIVFMTGQALGLVIYVRNLMLIYRQRTRVRRGLPLDGAAATARNVEPSDVTGSS